MCDGGTLQKNINHRLYIFGSRYVDIYHPIRGKKLPPRPFLSFELACVHLYKYEFNLINSTNYKKKKVCDEGTFLAVLCVFPN